jgi:N6-adenosine-specific RNA methylase IME4
MAYDLIYADPPWAQKKGGLRKARPNQGKALDYPTLSIDDIKKQLQTFTSDPQIIFCWAIEKFLIPTQLMLEELGFRLHTRLVWDKKNGIAPAFSVRFCHEYLLWMYAGKFQPVATEQRGKWSSVIEEKARGHSVKPEKAYELIEALYPTHSKIELYARRPRTNWAAWGNEVTW